MIETCGEIGALGKSGGIKLIFAELLERWKKVMEGELLV
jgi:hypothetical protein